MHLIPYILDRQTRICNGSVHEVSLLTLPLGMGSMIDHLAGQFEPIECARPAVVPMFQCEPGYAQRVRLATSAAIEVIDQSEFKRRVRESESSDFLLLIDPSNWPTRGYDFGELVGRLNGFRGATHVVAIGTDPERLAEQVECDSAGRVSKVRRMYHRMTWPEVPAAPVLVSVLPAQVLGDIEFVDLADLRARLAARGLLIQDMPLRADTVDLSVEAGWLALGERSLRMGERKSVRKVGSKPSAGIVLGERCRVHPTARLRAPVVIQDGAVIEANAVVVGPSILGASCHVGEGAVVAQAVLASGASIPPGDRISHCVVPGNGHAGEAIARHRKPAAKRTRWSRIRAASDSEDTISHKALAGKPVQRVVKRVFDVSCAAAGLILLSPVLLAAAVLIKLTSPGPVFFVHRREGRWGKEFPCLKFRTMVAGAHKRQREMYDQNNLDGPQFKKENDPRVTRLGEWLRCTNVDELPQLLNVLVGQMSLVGPRPSPFRENQICVPWRRARLSVRPGITGLWQICRDRRAEGDFHQWIFYDLRYVRSFSFWLDLKVLFYTLVTLGGRKSVPLSRLVGSPQD